MTESVLDAVLCVRCAGALDLRAPAIVCGTCREAYPRLGGIHVVVPQVDAHLSLWVMQLELIARQAQEQFARLEAEAKTPGLLPATERRLRGLAHAVREQVIGVLTLLEPALAVATQGEASRMTLPPDAQMPLKYIHYLYRDWAWDQIGNDENRRTLEALRAVLSTGPLGRTLVLGAGGCRLPYELHRSFGTSETVALDIDPFLFVVAEAVIRGHEVSLTEANLAVQEAGNVFRPWTLAAPAPLDDRFHFLLANGLAPPFAPERFDTVVTPWFIDQVPPDMGTFLATLRSMLKPGGRWVNQGPLLYPTELPLVRRHTREELFDLAAREGFAIKKWAGESRPYLISPLNGRGKVEWVLTFEAVRER